LVLDVASIVKSPMKSLRKTGGYKRLDEINGVGSRLFQEHFSNGYLIAMCAARWPPGRGWSLRSDWIGAGRSGFLL
jgi:hypothetical protein